MDATDTLLMSGRAGEAEGDAPASGEGQAPDTSEANGAASHSSEANSIPSADDFSHAGEMLAAARKAMDLDLETISTRINVKAERLEAIETLNRSALPAPTFTLGFVRAYARTLNLPEDALVERFRRDAGYPEPRKAPVLEPKLQKDLGTSQQVSLFTILLITGGVLWIIWQVLQASAPQEAQLAEGASEGIPLVERAQSSTGATIQVTTDLSDEQSLGDSLSLPTDMAPATEPVVTANTGSDEVVLDITTEELERALADGEEAARTASLARVRAAENEAGIETAQLEIPSPSAEEGEGDIDIPAVTTEEETAEDAAPVMSEADRLNAEALNRLALEGAGGTSTEVEEEQTPAPAEEGPEAELAAAELTEDGIAIVPASEDDPAETVVAQPVVDGRVPATIRTAVEAVYPSRCESTAADTETVTVTYSVSRYGKVVNPEVSATSNPCFNRAAIAAVSRWDFFPAEEDGRGITDAGRTSRVVFRRP